MFSRDVIKIIAPILPHISEEAWEHNGGQSSVFNEAYPDFDSSLAEEANISIAIQVNGKLRGTIDVGRDISKNELITKAKEQENVSIHIGKSKIVKEIVVPQKLVNFVVK